MSNRNVSSFSAADQRVYCTNVRLNTFDINTERIVNDISNTIVPLLNNLKVSVTGPVGVSGLYNGLVGITGNFPSTVGITGNVSINISSGITGSVNLTQGITGSVNLTQGITGQVKLTEGITGSVNLTQGITGQVNLTQGITGSVNLTQGITGQVKLTEGITGSVNLTQGITGQVKLTEGITGSINLTQGITGSVNLTQGITGSVNLTQGITGEVNLTQGITGSVNLTQGITGQVKLTEGITGSVNLTQGITGSVNLTQGITGSVNLTQGITGSVNLTQGITGSVNLTQGVTGSVNLTQGITGSVNLTQGITGSVILTQGITGEVNLTQGITGSVNLTQGVTGSVNLTQGITGSVNLTQGITGSVNLTQGITGSVNLTQGITGNVSVNNFPSTFGVSGLYNGLVGITGEISTSITPGTYVSLTGSAYTLLNTIETDISSGVLVKGTDDTGLRSNFYVDVNGVQRAQVIPKNIENFSYIFETDLSQIITGSVSFWSVEDRREGWAFDNSGGAAILDFYSNPLSAPPALNFNKAQALWFVAALDKLTAPPLLKVITNGPSVWHYAISPTSALYNGEFYLFYYGNKAIAENPEFRPFLLTRTLISGPGANAETITNVQVITAIPGGAFTLNRSGLWNQDLNLPFHTFFKSNAEFTATSKLNSLTFTSTNLNVALSNSAKVQIHDGTDTAAVVPVITEISPQNGLCTVSALYGLNVASGDVFPLTTDISGDLNQLHVKDDSLNTKLVQTYNTNNTTIDPGYGRNGLNVFQILPKIKTYAMGGTNPNAAVADTLFGGSTTTLRVDTTSFGYANQKTFYGFIPTGNTARSIKYDYIDASGIEQVATTALTVNSYTTLFTGSGINSFKIAGNVNPGSSDLIYITINTSSTANNVGSLNIRNHYNGVFTCPANAVAMVTSFDYNLSTAAETFYMHIFDSVGNRQSVYAGYAYQTGVNNFRANPEGLGRMILPLESVCFSNSSTAPTGKFLYYTVQVKYF